MDTDTGHDEIRALLPWHLSGTLRREEAAAVETHLLACESCRVELEGLRRLQAAVRASVESRPAPSPDLFARIAARVATEPRRGPEPARRASWWGSLQVWAAALTVPRLAPALALGVIVFQFGAIAVLGTRLYQGRRAPVMVTQSGPETARQAAEGLTLRVAFHEGATVAQIAAVLHETRARIVDGPSAAGFYVVAVAAGPESSQAAASLRRQAAVVKFVEELP
jgi:predicted anti-sigma-YlaC factor YlaD